MPFQKVHHPPPPPPPPFTFLMVRPLHFSFRLGFPALCSGYKFSSALAPVTFSCVSISISYTFCLTLALLACLFAHNTGYMFSRALVGIGFMFSRATYWSKFSRAWHRLHVFPRFAFVIFALSSHWIIKVILLFGQM